MFDRLTLAPLAALGILALIHAAPARAETLCTLIADADTGAVLLEQGSCDTRTTPASTFKVALAVMGYDSGVLHTDTDPTLSYAPGDPDWGGTDWTQDTTPLRWMTYSVLWYSQHLTRALGTDTLSRYAQAFGYGNADVSGDPGLNNGLERSWIASSLLISPREQVAFLRRVVTDDLPVSPNAMARTRAIVQRFDTAGWSLQGKTGTAYPRRADRGFDYARGWGWFVGWAQSADRTLIFARLTQATQRTTGSPGNLTRDAFLADWPTLVSALPEPGR